MEYPSKYLKFSIKAQTAIEVLFLYAVVVAIVLVGYHTYLPRVKNASEAYFTNSVNTIVGKANSCGDGVCAHICDSSGCRALEDARTCCVDCLSDGTNGCSCVTLGGTDYCP